MKKTLLIAIITLTLISCGSTKLDKGETEKTDAISKIKYAITPTDYWKSYESHGYTNYTPKEKKDDYYENHFYVLKMDDEINRRYNLETFANFRVRNMSKAFDSFKHNIASKNTRFGIVFIINSTKIWKGEKYKETTQIYEYNEKLYTLTYSALIKTFEEHKLAVNEIFNTFEIIDNGPKIRKKTTAPRIRIN